MTVNHQIVSALQQLVAGDFSAEEWLEWWAANSELKAGELNRGQWLRLKPRQPGGFGPPCRCALVSQQEASKLLKSWGIQHDLSSRYQQEWDTAFEEFTAEQERQLKEKQKQFLPRLECLSAEFPKLSGFLRRHLDEIEELGAPASSEEIAHLEHAIGAPLAESFRRFLSCTSCLVYGDEASIGLQYTFRHPAYNPNSPSANRICFGEYWLEGDGDQLLFGDAEEDMEPPILYYNHSEPSCEVLAEDFKAWAESLPETLSD